MRLLLLLTAPVLCFGAGISSVTVLGSTNVQSALSYQAPDSGSCTLEVSESPSYRPLVKDIDPSIFPGADVDNRAGNVANGTLRVFLMGKRAVEQGADGKWYSRALQADTLHYYRLHCGSETTAGAFRTANIPTGVTYGWPVPQDPATGQFRWPSTDGNDRTQTIIDPNHGTLIKRVSVPGDAPADVGTRKQPFGAAAGANWTAAASALTDDGGSATYFGTTQDWLTLTNSTLSGLADFYAASTAVDSIAVRIKGSSGGSTEDLRKIDVCLTLDGQTCRGDTRQVVLDSTESVKTLGGGPALDLWGAGPLWPVDLARNKNFGVMIRASGAARTSVAVQYVEVDVSLSQMMYMPEGGFLQVCSSEKSNGGYHCTFVSSLGTNHLYWIQPETGEVRWLGQVIASGWGGPTTLCGSSYAYFDVKDSNTYYCEAQLNGRSVLLKGTYTGNDVAAPAGSTAALKWVNLTPAGSTIPELIHQFDPEYDPAKFGPTLGLMTNGYFVYRGWKTGQDSLAWLAVFDVGNGEPIGSGGTGKIVAATKAFAAPNTRWCGLHTVEFVGHQNWFGWDAITATSGGNDATGPFQVKLASDLPASTGRFTIQVTGEPTPYVMDTAVGDVFQIAGAPSPGWDFVRIVSKVSPTQWVVDRTVTHTGVTAHAAGTTMAAFCNARQLNIPNQGAYVYWDFLNDPKAQDATGRRWVVEKTLTGGHIVQRGDYRIMEATDGYSVLTPGFPRSLNQPRSYAISGNPQWRGVYPNKMPEGLGNGFMQHESYENWAATDPGRSNWFTDMIPFIGTSYVLSSVKPVTGSNQVYKAIGTKIHRDLFPTWGLCGARQLKDISPGPIADSDSYSFCVGAKCSSGAASTDVFVNCPPPVSAKSSCTPFPQGDPTSVCVGDSMAYMQSVTQFFLDPAGKGVRNRVLTNALYAWHGRRTMGYFDTAYSLPDGSWVIFSSWGNNGRKDLYMVKVPRQPNFDANPQWGQQPVQQTISVAAPAGATSAQWTFGVGNAYTQACSGGTCSEDITLLPSSMVIAQPLFLNGSGQQVGVGQPSTRIATGLQGSGVGPPTLAATNAVTNGLSFQPQIAPGSIVSIFGQDLANCEASAPAPPLPTSLCDASVTFNGTPAYLFYANTTQINAQLPSSIQPGQPVTVVASRAGTASGSYVVPGTDVGATAPALAAYSLDGVTLRAVVQTPDGSIAGPKRPLKWGESGTLFVNGLGATTPAVPDGQAAPAQPPAVVNGKVEVIVNGISETVASAVLTPGSAGLYQVNFKLAPLTPVTTADINMIWIRVNGVESPRVLVNVSQ